MKILITILAFSASSVWAKFEAPPALEDVAVHSRVTLETTSNRYRYSYTVTNNSGTYTVGSLGISVARSHLNEGTLPNSGLTLPMLGVNTPDQIVPAQCLKTAGWMCIYMPNKFLTFCAMEGSNIKTKTKSNALEFFSYGLPAIRSVVLTPDIDIERFPEEGSDDNTSDHFEDSVNWHGKSIGPTYPPYVVDTNFVDHILSLNEEALALKWITNADRSEDFKTYLTAVKKKMTARNLKGAHATLKSLMQELTKEQGKSLTSEGFALLYFNAKYLDEHL